MEMNAIQSGTSFGQTAQTTKDRSGISSDFETFLRMLTVQMKNQDPLNPVDSSDYAVQLATFSGVEQQVRTNDILSSLGQQLGVMGLSQLAGWVGMEARVAAPVYFGGTPVTIFPSISAAADAATLRVTNAAGKLVGQQSIVPSNDPMQWAGKDDDGNLLPPGVYSFQVESFANGNAIGSESARVYALVTEAKSDQGTTMVVLEGGTEVPASEISGLRAAGS